MTRPLGYVLQVLMTVPVFVVFLLAHVELTSLQIALGGTAALGLGTALAVACSRWDFDYRSSARRSP